MNSSVLTCKSSVSLFTTAKVAFLTLLTLGLGTTLWKARKEVSFQRAFERSMASTRVIAPSTMPEISQASINLALVMFGINVPASAEFPLLDQDLKDRGMTTRGAFMEKAKVTIGPAAFSSWGLLGSTLSHELEVHCQQNFLAIYVLDFVGLDGTGTAEREAYVHELKNARRFGLEIADSQMIADTMEYYYPDQAQGVGGTLPKSVRSWLAKTLLATSYRF